MSIFDYQRELTRALTRAHIPRGVKTEHDMESRFVVPQAVRLAESQADILLFCHPWGNRARRADGCAKKPPGGRGRLVGCPDCWRASKAWATVEAFGTRHTFDMMAKDSQTRTLAVEVKLVSARGGRMPNGDVQRFLGQVALAVTRHDAVIGFCGYRGALNASWQDQTKQVKRWFERRNAQLVFREVG